MPTKKSKEEVEYSKGHLHSHCGPISGGDTYYCRSFRHGSPSTCVKVAGPIRADHWCKEYTRTGKDDAGPG